MKKINKIIMSILWTLVGLSILSIGIYNIVDNTQACLWAWFLPAIVALVAGGYTAIYFVVKSIVNKKTMIQENK